MMIEKPDSKDRIEELLPQSFGLPDDLPPGTVILTVQAHNLLEAMFFNDGEPMVVDKWLPWRLRLLAGIAESVVVSPRVFTASGSSLGDSSRHWELLPVVEFWEPFRLSPLQSPGDRVITKLIDAGRRVAEHAATGQGITHPNYIATMKRFTHEYERCLCLVLADAFGVSVRLTDYDAMALGYLLLACDKDLRPMAEPTATLLLRQVEKRRTQFFTGIAEHSYFDYYDLHLPAILSIALREARTGEPTSLLEVLSEMRKEKAATAFRSWASSVDRLLDRPHERGNVLAEAHALLGQLASDLSAPVPGPSVSLQVSPLPPFFQLVIGDALVARLRSAYRRRKRHLAFLRSVYSESLEIGRMADDLVRVFGVHPSRVGTVQFYVRQAFAPATSSCSEP